MQRCSWPGEDELYIQYHDEEWGVPVHDDRKHFEFLVLESAQAGLSWRTVLNKRENYRMAYGNFDPRIVAEYNDKKIIGLLNNKGITVYNNTPLLGRINDTPDAIHHLAYGCRKSGIEFHHLYVAGLPIQNHWNTKNPVSLYDVVDIATRVRREGSGREVPRYIIRTVLGEVDFGLSSTINGESTNLSVKLLPYEFSHFQDLSPDFTWPDAIKEDVDGKPIVSVAGLLKTTDFALS